ncbi:hypothetical protein BGX21_004481, partial [Mortierella sp. AD011]
MEPVSSKRIQNAEGPSSTSSGPVTSKKPTTIDIWGSILDNPNLFCIEEFPRRGTVFNLKKAIKEVNPKSIECDHKDLKLYLTKAAGGNDLSGLTELGPKMVVGDIQDIDEFEILVQQPEK